MPCLSKNVDSFCKANILFLKPLIPVIGFDESSEQFLPKINRCSF